MFLKYLYYSKKLQKRSKQTKKFQNQTLIMVKAKNIRKKLFETVPFISIKYKNIN